jgi:hypothetical protein
MDHQSVDLQEQNCAMDQSFTLLLLESQNPGNLISYPQILILQTILHTYPQILILQTILHTCRIYEDY